MLRTEDAGHSTVLYTMYIYLYTITSRPQAANVAQMINVINMNCHLVYIHYEKRVQSCIIATTCIWYQEIFQCAVQCLPAENMLQR
jgi:ribonucleotide reductase beta subunit family protein with ferritin-like domain